MTYLLQFFVFSLTFVECFVAQLTSCSHISYLCTHIWGLRRGRAPGRRRTAPVCHRPGCGRTRRPSRIKSLCPHTPPPCQGHATSRWKSSHTFLLSRQIQRWKNPQSILFQYSGVQELSFEKANHHIYSTTHTLLMVNDGWALRWQSDSGRLASFTEDLLNSSWMENAKNLKLYKISARILRESGLCAEWILCCRLRVCIKTLRLHSALLTPHVLHDCIDCTVLEGLCRYAGGSLYS